MRQGPQFALLIAALFPLTGVCRAQESQSADVADRIVTYAGGRLGVLKLERVHEGTFSVGVLGGLTVSQTVSLEGSLDFNTAGDFLTDEWWSPLLQVRRETWTLQATLRLFPFPRLERFRPYVLGGIGGYYSHYKSGDDDVQDLAADDSSTVGYRAAVSTASTNSDEADVFPARTRVFGYHLGVGADLLVDDDAEGDRTYLACDLRYIYTREDIGERMMHVAGFLFTIGVRQEF